MGVGWVGGGGNHGVWNDGDDIHTRDDVGTTPMMWGPSVSTPQSYNHVGSHLQLS